MSNQEHGWSVYSYTGKCVTLTHEGHEEMPAFVAEDTVAQLRAEIDRLRTALIGISEYGSKNTGYGLTCAKMADDALGCGPQPISYAAAGRY